MLVLRVVLDPSRPSRPWSLIDGTVTDGRSWVTPVRHPAVSATVTATGCGIRVDVHERGGDEITVDITPWRTEITAGSRGTAPLYLATRGSVLEASWDLAHLASHVDPANLADRAVARTLTRQPRYGADTVFPAVRMLTERATAVHDCRGLAISYPDAARHVAVPRTLKPDVDPIDALHEQLHDAIATKLPAGEVAAVELSGGLDSATVASAVTQDRDAESVAALGLLIGGVDGRHQRLRRAALMSRLGLRDAAVDALAHPPFAPTGCRATGVPHDPTGAFYREAFDAMRDRAAELGVTSVVTGLGGDELLALRTPAPTIEPSQPGVALSVPPWLGTRTRAALPDIDSGIAPVSVVPLPALTSLAMHNPAYLRAGIWPSSPLTDPRLVRFAEQLPVEWRRRKHLLRELLRRAGLPRHVTHPVRPESFSELMQLGLRRYGLGYLRHMLRESILIDSGYVDGDALTTAYRDAVAGHRIPSLLCDTIALELGLRSLTGPPHPDNPLTSHASAGHMPASESRLSEVAS